MRKTNTQSWPGGPNRPRIAVYNVGTGDVRRELITTESVYEQIQLEVALHDQDTGLATYDCGEAMEAALLADDWDTLAGITPADGSWGYPAFEVLDQDAVRLLGGG